MNESILTVNSPFSDYSYDKKNKNINLEALDTFAKCIIDDIGKLKGNNYFFLFFIQLSSF